MQLFILDHSPAAAAQMLCDVHLRKMCLETAQILSGTAFLQGKKLPESMPGIYNPAHPVIKAINTPFKVNWTIDHFSALHREYFHRFGKTHAFTPLVPLYHDLLYANDPGEPQWDFARAFKNFSTDIPDIVQAYRAYYRHKKTLIKRWSYTNSKEPVWLTSR